MIFYRQLVPYSRFPAHLFRLDNTLRIHKDRGGDANTSYYCQVYLAQASALVSESVAHCDEQHEVSS